MLVRLARIRTPDEPDTTAILKMLHDAHVAHHTKGRIRLRLPNAKRDHAALEKVKRALAPMPGVQSVDVNPTTGSVVIQYDPAKHDDFHEALSGHAEEQNLFTLAPPRLSEVDEIAETIQKEAEFLAARSETAKSIVDFFTGLNREVKNATNNSVDLQVLLPLGLAVYSFFAIEGELATPLWVTLGIFSFNSFVSLHHHPPAAAVAGTEDPQPASPRKTVPKGGA
jgi:cation transport ATPase